MRRHRVLITVALVAAGLIGPAAGAHAQCSSGSIIEDQLALAEVAFVGRVVDRSSRDRTAIMEVLEVWKGSRLPQRVTVNGGPENITQHTSIDRTFLLGQIYLVLPANDRDPFQDSQCTGTRLWSTPTGSIPSHLQDAVGGATPIPLLANPGQTGIGDATAPAGVDPLVVAMVIVGLTFVVVVVSRRGRSGLKSNRKTTTREVAGGSKVVSPSIVRRRRRTVRKRGSSSPLQSKGPSRLDQVRKGSGRFRKGPGEHERKQLERAVKARATTPPSRRNHYASGRRSAP